MNCNIEKKYGPCEVRRPSKKADNQYTLIKTQGHQFFALFKDGEGKDQESEITEAVYLELLQQTREDDARLRWQSRHKDDHFDMDTLSNVTVDHNYRSLEDAVTERVLSDEGHPLLRVLSVTQRRRVVMRYLEKMTLEEIAQQESCSIAAVKYCLDIAITTLQKYFSKIPSET